MEGVLYFMEWKGCSAVFIMRVFLGVEGVLCSVVFRGGDALWSVTGQCLEAFFSRVIH